MFTDAAELPETDKFKDPQIKWHQAYFDLADDEALVVEVTPPECEYWMIALHNHWMETLDYVHHQATLNCHSAQLEPDGSVRFVIAHHDPGVANWLDTAGHSNGAMILRCVRTTTAPTPRGRVVSFENIASALPADTKRLTADERASILDRRRRAVHERFGR